MSYWVRRTNADTGRDSWTGPIRSAAQVEREAAAWRSAGWAAEVLRSSPEVRAAVRAWEKAKRTRDIGIG